MKEFFDEHFYYWCTDFEVDLIKSKIGWNTRADGKWELNIDIYGKQGIFDRLSESEESEWSWALYPPAFFLHGFAVREEQRDAAQFLRFETTSNEYELGIYMMEYSDCSHVRIEEFSSERFAILGSADFWGKNLQFRIDMPIKV